MNSNRLVEYLIFAKGIAFSEIPVMFTAPSWLKFPWVQLARLVVPVTLSETWMLPKITLTAASRRPDSSIARVFNSYSHPPARLASHRATFYPVAPAC